MNLYDLALCIDNNDNQMTFVGHIVCVPRSIICALQKSCDCPICLRQNSEANLEEIILT